MWDVDATGLRITFAFASGALSFVAQAQQLPVPCASGACGAGMTWVTSGAAAATTVGNQLTVTQESADAILNWASFDVGAESSVRFNQPGSDAVALNRIFQADPSRILGSISANGQIYLINPNGIVFGNGAQVNVHTLVASTLDVDSAVLEQGVFAPLLAGRPAFELNRRFDENGNALPGGSISVESGAVLQTASGGRIMLLAPTVENRGTIRTPDGQSILAAGERVWIADSSDADLRGFVVEVDAGGDVRNLGEIVAERGNVSLAGLAVNQEGRVSASTSISLGGSIRLVARDTVRIQPGSGALVTERTGSVRFGAGSATEVLPDFSDTSTAIDEQEQPQSSIEVVGLTIAVQDAARLVATSGTIDLLATANPAQPLTGQTANNGARIDIAQGAVLDVSGTENVLLPMERNVLSVELRANELRDSPLQRDSILYGERINVDLRVGTPIADISGALGTIKRGIGERTTPGGSILLRSEDGLSVGAGATLDISGGNIQYESGWINTTQLVSEGRVFDISEADPDRHYDAILEEYEETSFRWNVTTRYAVPGSSPGTYETGYVEGKDAGTLTLLGNQMQIAGVINGETVQGRWQRELPTDVTLPWARPVTELPLGGQLILGDASQLSAVAGTANFRLPGVLFQPADGDSGNALANHSLPDDTLVLDPGLFTAGGLSRVAIYSNGRVVLPEDVLLELPAGGELTLVSGSVTGDAGDGTIAPSLQIDGDVRIPAGSITLRTVQNAAVGDTVQQDGRHVLTVGADAQLDVSGQWVNDSAAVAASLPTDVIAMDAGSISLSSAGGLSIADSADLLLNGGAWLDRSGELHAGRGGDLAVGSTLAAAATLHLGGNIESFGLVEGGSLRLTASGIEIADVAGGGIAQSGNGIWTFDPALFQQGGFSDYRLTATHFGLTLQEGTVVEPRAMNSVLDQAAYYAPTGTSFATLTQRERLPDDQRQPVNLTLASQRGAVGADLDAALTIAAGAAINADPGATVTLSSDRMLVVDGAITAPAGQITLSLTANRDIDPGFLPDKAIWLGAGAVLATPAHVQLIPNPLGLRQGEVRAGGTVTLSAQRGAVVTAPGSLIDVSGAVATLDILQPDAAGQPYAPTVVVGAAGTLQIEAPDGILMAGQLRAHAADAAGAAGGTLVVSLGSAEPLPDVQTGNVKYPAGTRDLAFVNAEPDVLFGTLHPGDSMFSAADLAALGTLDNDVESRGFISLLQLQQAGLDVIEAGVTPVMRAGLPTGDARISFDADAQLQASARIVLDTPVIAGNGGDALLEAAYIAIGPTDTTLRLESTAQSGAGTLTARAGLIDLIGDIAIQGFGTVAQPALHLQSSGDIRLRGLRIPNTDAAEATGSLTVAGILRADAAQLYPTTLSDFTLAATGAGSAVLLGTAGDAASVPLSAGGVLRVTSERIEVSGTLRAPHGQILLDASDALTLAAGSEISVAGPALPVPYGQTQFGLDWVLPYEPTLSRVLGGPEDESWSAALPEKRIDLAADNLQLDPGAQVVLDGGGDLYAWEFIPGPGGSVDVLLPENSAGAFAILPASLTAAAPVDPFMSYAGLEVGDTIEIGSDIAGLSAGTYTLLPARYALLPGAYLLTPVADSTGLASAAAYVTQTGIPVVAARRGTEAAGTHESLWSGYQVETGAQVRERAEYTESLASSFFAESVASQLPADAGRLVLNAGSALFLGANVSAVAGESGRGGQVDIIADVLAVVDALTGQTDRVELLAEGLRQLEVESLLLGGQREETADGIRIIAESQSVSIESGVDLEFPEIMVVAGAGGSGSTTPAGVLVEGGASLQGVGETATTPAQYLIEGDTALLRVSSGSAAVIQRDALPTGQFSAPLVLEDGSVLVAGVPENGGLTGGSITLDSSGDAASSATLTLGTEGSLQLAASRISLGDVLSATGIQGLVLSQEALARLNVSNLFLESASSIDLYGQLDLTVSGALVLDTPELRGVATNAGPTASLRANTLSWRSSSAVPASDPVTGLSGQLTLSASVLQIGGVTGDARSDLAVRGFELTQFIGDREFIAAEEGALTIAGALQIATPWVTTTDGADWHIAAGGVLTIAAGTASVERPANPGLGSAFELSGSEVRVDGRILLPAGSVMLRAAGTDPNGSGTLQLTNNALLDVASVQEAFLDQAVATPAGQVALVSEQGDVLLDAGSTIDVSGSDGLLTIRAQDTAIVGGSLVANADGGNAGSFSITAGNLGSFNALNDKLNAGGFGATRYIRLRTGDVTVGAGETIRAQDIVLVLDGEPVAVGGTQTGRFELGGTIDASGEIAGSVRISARGDIALAATGRIDAHATGQDREGGEVELATTEGVVSIDGQAVIDVRGTRTVSYGRTVLDANGQPIPRTDALGTPLLDLLGQPLYVVEELNAADTGQVRYRMSRVALLDTARQPRLDGAVLGAGRVDIEAFQTYIDADGMLDAQDVAPVAGNLLFQDAVDFMAHETEILGALGVLDDARFHLLPGIEIGSAGNLTLASAWDLAQWRFGGRSEPGALTLRAEGNIVFEQALSDGVVRALDPVFFVEKDYLLDGASWSFNIAAGADLASASALAVRPGSGDVVVAAAAMIRTGTGDIVIRAGRDVVLSDTTSVVYTGGLDAGIGTLDPALVSLYMDGIYPVLGGDIDIVATRNVEAVVSEQLINDWLWRLGGEDPSLGELPTAWSVNLTNFRQGIAAFGGGNVSVAAGEDVRNLSVSVPTTGRQVGTVSFDPVAGRFSVESDEVVIQGGDGLVVRAGGDIVGGIYYIGRGVGELTAGGDLTRQDDRSLYPMLALGAGEWHVTAGQDAAVETVFNPTLVKQALQQGFQPTLGSEFSTYADGSLLRVTAIAGEVLLNQDLSVIQTHPFLSGRSVDPSQLQRYVLYPGSLYASSFRGDIVVARSLDLAAAPDGQLALLADGDILPERGAQPTVRMLDAIDAPPIHLGDSDPARIVARQGDIGGDVLGFNLPKAVWLEAGGDIRNVRLDTQHLDALDVTTVRAGGSIVHDTARAANGALTGSTSLLYYRVAGPGNVEFVAGESVDLGTAGGILTTGNTTNPYLPDEGASVTVLAGLREPPRIDAFIDAYLIATTEYATALAGYLRNYDTDPSRSDIDNFRSLPAEQQRPFLWQVFFSELRVSGVDAAESGDNDFSRGFEAVNVLFPDQLYDQERPADDLSLLLSRISTLAGGDITLIVPGGGANAGVATTSQLIKTPEELGIVVQRSGDINAFVRGDFLVNQSRVFTLDGGDILMWSSFGDIDAGRGAKSAIAAPPPTVTTDPETGNTIIAFPPAIAGSGIRAVVTSTGVEPGDVYLFAPSGVVSAGDAGIGSAGNLTIAATRVIGADNIDVGGVAVGVPVETGGLGASLASVSSTSSSASNAAVPADTTGTNDDTQQASLAETALSWLEVFVVGLGEDSCRQDDLACLNRQSESNGE